MLRGAARPAEPAPAEDVAARGAACARARSTSSSARPSSRSTCRSSSRRPAAAGQAADHLLFAGPPGLGKTSLAGIVATEMGVGLPDHVGPGHRAGRRPRRHPHQPRRGRRPLHRRDPPPARAGRGGALPGDGGLPARHRAGQGPGGPVDPPRPAPLHPRRRHHPHRPHHRPAARPLRPRRPPRLLRAEPTSRPSSSAPPASSACASRPTARRDRRPGRGTPRIANRLLRRVRDFAEVRGDGTVDRPRRTTASPCSASTSSASTRSTAPSSRDLRALRRWAGRALDAGHQRRRADRDGRGRLRAVPHPAGPAHAHAPRPGGHPGGVGPRRPRTARPVGPRALLVHEARSAARGLGVSSGSATASARFP